MKISEKAIFKVVVALGLLMISLIIVSFKVKHPQANREISYWPDISINKIVGDNYDANKQLFRYVQFMGTPDKNNIDLLKSVYEAWADKIIIIIFVNNADSLIKAIDIDLSKAFIISDKYDERMNLYKSTRYGKHYLFDEKGVLLFSSDNNSGYEYGILRPLLEYVERRNFDVSRLISDKDNIHNNLEYIQIDQVLNSIREEYLLVCFISNYCDSCGSGILIETFKKIQNNASNPFKIILILSREYNDIEKEQMISQLNINYTVIIADNILNSKWEKLIKESTKNYYSNIVAVINRDGKVEKVLDPYCNGCAPLFWNWIKERIDRKEGK